MTAGISSGIKFIMGGTVQSRGTVNYNNSVEDRTNRYRIFPKRVISTSWNVQSKIFKCFSYFETFLNNVANINPDRITNLGVVIAWGEIDGNERHKWNFSLLYITIIFSLFSPLPLWKILYLKCSQNLTKWRTLVLSIYLQQKLYFPCCFFFLHYYPNWLTK